MSHWLDDAAKGVAEGRFSRRDVLRRGGSVAVASMLAPLAAPAVASAHRRCKHGEKLCHDTCYSPHKHHCCHGQLCEKGRVCCGGKTCCDEDYCHDGDCKKKPPKKPTCDPPCDQGAGETCCAGNHCCEKGSTCCGDGSAGQSKTCCSEGSTCCGGIVCCSGGDACCVYDTRYYEPGGSGPATWAACYSPQLEVCCPSGPCAGCCCESNKLCNNGGTFPPAVCDPAC